MSDEEETGGVVILRQEMWRRLGRFSTKVEPQMKQETAATDTVIKVEKIHEMVWIQATLENQLGDALTSIDNLEVMDAIKDECEEISKQQKNIVEKREVEKLTTIQVAKHIETTEAET